MALPDLTQIDLGYISGADLMQYLPVQFLQNIYQVNSGVPANTANIFQRSAKMGRDAVSSYLSNIYNMTIEYAIPSLAVPDLRNGIVLEAVLIYACMEIAKNSDAVKEPLMFEYNNIFGESGTMKDYRNNISTIPGLISADENIRSVPVLINQAYKYRR